MRNIESDTLGAYDRYFNKLSNFGKSSDSDIQTIMLLSFINGIVNGPMKEFVDEGDYQVLNKVLQCLQGHTCLIDYHDFELKRSIIFDSSPFNVLSVKILENGKDNRFTEDNNIRFHML